jgi:hypothetical protein
VVDLPTPTTRAYDMFVMWVLMLTVDLIVTVTFDMDVVVTGCRRCAIRVAMCSSTVYYVQHVLLGARIDTA